MNYKVLLDDEYYLRRESQLYQLASIAQLEERKTEDLDVAGSIPARGNFLLFSLSTVLL